MTTTATATFLATTIDCADASAQAAFWAGLLGWETTYDADGMAAVEGGGHTLYFGAVEGYAAPAWPDPEAGKQFHLDLRGPAGQQPASMAERVTELGGSMPEHQPGDGRWIVFLDPAGHPFCISGG